MARSAVRQSLQLAAAGMMVVVSTAGWAAAAPVLPNTWYEFGFDGVGVAATGCDPEDPAGPFCTPSSGTPASFAPAAPWTIILPVGATLLVTDAFLSGDQFQVFDFGASLGVTSLPAAGAVIDCGDDPVPCVANPAMSHGMFALGAGAHSITITPILSPEGLGAGYFRVDAPAIPEPASLLLLLTGLGLGIGRRRRL